MQKFFPSQDCPPVYQYSTWGYMTLRYEMLFLNRESYKPPKSQDHETNQNRFAIQ